MAAYHFQQGDRPLDGYTIQYALGRGGFGEVYFAVSDSGREIALKAVQNFEDVELRGIGHCMNLKSPHLVMIFDVKHAADGTPWVIMEYVSGPSLRDILDESPDGLSVDQATFFLRELARGLSYLHEAGVVHRDLKPHNVFFEDGIVKIGDYSLSKVITTSHRSGNTMTVGSVHYMAPEISLGRYDKTVDIYALGVLLYEMLTGEPPYVGESMGEVLMKHLSSDPDVSELPEPFAAVISKAMQRDPADRFQSTEEMIQAITGDEPDRLLDDSFNPATLSLVGERAQRAKAGRAAAVAVEARPAPPAVRRSTTPTSGLDVDTSQYPGTARETPAVPRRELLHRLGLRYEPTGRVHATPDVLSWYTRLLIACIVSWIMMVLATALGTRPPMSLATMLGATICVVGISAVATLACCCWMPFQRTTWAGVGARLAWFVSAGMAAGFVLRLHPVTFPPSPYLPSAWSVAIVAMTIPDLRCLIAADRRTRMAPFTILFVGCVAGIIGAGQNVPQGTAIWPVAFALAIAMNVQLLAPLRRAASDAPLIPTPPSVGKPRLLYDGWAMILELVVGACIVTVIAAFVNLRDEAELLIVCVPAVLIGVFTLRFRLHRRAWPERRWATTGGTSPEQNAASGKVVFDWLSVVLEMFIVGCGILVVALIIDGDDDFLPLGVSVTVLGLLAFRIRLHRRAAADSSRRITRPITTLNALSVVLELFLGICVVVIVCSLYVGGSYAGGEEPYLVAAVFAALGIVAFRFRLARRLVPQSTERGAANSGDQQGNQPRHGPQEIH